MPCFHSTKRDVKKNLSAYAGEESGIISMPGLFFEFSSSAVIACLLFAALAIIIWKWRSQFSSPRLYFSNVNDLTTSQISKNIPWAKRLKIASLCFFIAAFIDPHFYVAKTKNEKESSAEGIAIYLLVDRSGSMHEKVDSLFGKIPKIELLKKITTEFVVGDPKANLPGRPNDLIGLIAFSRSAQVLSPLTLDHEAIVKTLSNLDTVHNPLQDGTAIGYALYKASNIIVATRHYAQDLIGNDRPAYDIKNSIIILITDGFHAPSPLDKDNPRRNINPLEAAEYAKEHHVRIYLVNIEPALLTNPEFAPQRRMLESVTKITGGRFYMMDSSNSLENIFADIDQLEKSRLPITETSKKAQPQHYTRISLYPALIAIGMICLFLAIVLKTIVWRMVP